MPTNYDTPNLAPSVKRGCHFFFYRLINSKLVHYIMLNISLVLHSVAMDYKLYTSSIYESVQHFTYLHCLQNEQSFIYKIYQKVFQWAPSDAWPLTADVDCPVP